MSDLIKFIGFLTLVVCALWWAFAGYFIWQGKKTTGSIVSLSGLANGSFDTSYTTVGLQRPVVHFDIDQSSFTFVALPTPAEHYHIGDSIELYYDPSDASRAYTSSDLLGWPVILFILGEVFYFAGKLFASGNRLG